MLSSVIERAKGNDTFNWQEAFQILNREIDSMSVHNPDSILWIAMSLKQQKIDIPSVAHLSFIAAANSLDHADRRPVLARLIRKYLPVTP